MRPPLPGRQGLLLATALLATPAIGGCQRPGAEQPALRWAPQCADPVDDPETLGFCLYKAVGAVHEVEAMLEVCTAAGTWEARCRHTWVIGHRPGRDLDTLLPLCGSSDDCALELLDLEPAGDPAVQLRRCIDHAGGHVEDCVGHALQRWYQADPDEASFNRIAPLVPAASEGRGAYWLGAAVYCRGLGSCDQARPSVRERCASHIDAYEHSGEPGRRVFTCPETAEPPAPTSSRPPPSAPPRPDTLPPSDPGG